MLKKVFGVIAGLIGLAIIVFAVMAWRELHKAGKSASAPTADSMPLTRFVYPEFFEPGRAGATPAKPAELAQAAFRRIYIIGGGSFALIVVGIFMVVMPGNRNRAN